MSFWTIITEYVTELSVYVYIYIYRTVQRRKKRPKGQKFLIDRKVSPKYGTRDTRFYYSLGKIFKVILLPFLNSIVISYVC